MKLLGSIYRDTACRRQRGEWLKFKSLFPPCMTVWDLKPTNHRLIAGPIFAVCQSEWSDPVWPSWPNVSLFILKCLTIKTRSRTLPCKRLELQAVRSKKYRSSSSLDTDTVIQSLLVSRANTKNVIRICVFSGQSWGRWGFRHVKYIRLINIWY